jgi:hypothetical protein
MSSNAQALAYAREGDARHAERPRIELIGALSAMLRMATGGTESGQAKGRRTRRPSR